VDVIDVIARHGYAVTGIVLFLAALGLPLPISIVLLAAGAASHLELQPVVVLAIAWSAALAGDVLMFLGGRYTGWWLLAWICRMSLNPERCMFTSADAFYRSGPRTLLVAKFIPGLATVAAPLAGSLNLRFGRFIGLMAAGEALYCSTWIVAGYLFYKFIRVIASYIESAGHVLLMVLLLLGVGYGLTVLYFGLRSRRYRQIEKITAESLRERLGAVDTDRLMVIADVRSHNYYDPGMQRIKNSIRVEPNRLQEELAALREFMVPECEIYLYCSCIRDTTSLRVAHALKEADCRTTVIEGGLKAWVKAGGALEPVPKEDVRHLPRFD
jgi:membrane protein DedA with SNARE-associated domain/rhodanese-related sulfurtransferase